MKYTILMSCGHEDTVELLGKSADREKRIEYMKKYGMCTECYAEHLREQERKRGLVFNATVMPIIDEGDGSILVNVWYEGDTMPHKDEIKELGYRWSERISAQDSLSFKRPPLCWNKTIRYDELEKEAAQAVALGAASIVAESGLFASINYRIAVNKQNEWQQKQEKINAVVKTDVPELVSGRKWNKKIYGKAGGYMVYLDGDKICITDEQADVLKRYLEQKDMYDKEISQYK